MASYKNLLIAKFPRPTLHSSNTGTCGTFKHFRVGAAAGMLLLEVVVPLSFWQWTMVSSTMVVAVPPPTAATTVVAAKAGGHSMASASFDGGHATSSRHATRGQEGSVTRGREGGATSGNATTSRRKTRRWWRSERTTRGRDGGVTRGDAATRWRDEITRGRRSERMTRGRDGGAMSGNATTSLCD